MTTQLTPEQLAEFERRIAEGNGLTAGMSHKDAIKTLRWYAKSKGLCGTCTICGETGHFRSRHTRGATP